MAIAYANETMHQYVDYNSELTYDGAMIPSFCPIIELHISCQNLVNLDVGSKSDPVCILYTMQNGKFTEAARTEVIKNNLHPNFVTTFKTYYIFDFYQPLRFEVYDSDDESFSLQNDDFIGYCQTDVQHIVSNLEQSITFELLNDKKKGERGQLIITSEQTKESTIHLQGQIQVNELKKMKTFAKNNPFFEISKINKNGSTIPIYRSKVKKKCFSCAFKTFLIPLHFLYTDGLDDSILISFYDSQKRKAPKLIGEYRSSIGYFTQHIRTHFPIHSDSHKKSVGEFWFNRCEIVHIPTFANYLKSGIQLKMITAINFSISNGDQTSQNSYHYIHSDPNWLNQYQKSIVTVGSILSKFDKDQKFPVFGFAGKYDNQVSQCFPLTLNPNNPTVNGIQGILDAYKNCIKKVELKYPTIFTEIIKKSTKMAIENWNKAHIYSVLLIISDGGVDDMKDTVDAIVEASDAPLSIIIIGVGNWSFRDFEKLDSDDDYLYSSSGDRMKRDIVQFVSYKNIMNCSASKIEAEVLDELPLQLHEYCSSHDFIPPFQY